MHSPQETLDQISMPKVTSSKFQGHRIRDSFDLTSRIARMQQCFGWIRVHSSHFPLPFCIVLIILFFCLYEAAAWQASATKTYSSSYQPDHALTASLTQTHA